MIKITTTISILILLSLTTGCSKKQFDPEEMHQKGTYLTKLTRKAQVAVRHNITDSEQLYSVMNKKYPSLMKEFSEYSIFIKEHNGTAVILMCNAEKNKSLLEDAACTGAVEGGYFFEQNLSCQFHLDLKKVCNP